MTTFEIDGHVLYVDIEKTRAYTMTHSLCDCPMCRNYYAKVKECLPEVSDFLEQFGADIRSPEEIFGNDPVEAGQTKYWEVAYTINGRIGNPESLIRLPHRFPVQVEIKAGMNIPNEQENGEYFVVSLYNIVLPWTIDDPLPGIRKNSSKRLFGKFFKKTD